MCFCRWKIRGTGAAPTVETKSQIIYSMGRSTIDLCRIDFRKIKKRMPELKRVLASPPSVAN